MNLKDVRNDVRKLANKKDAEILQRFFKTGPGEYGEGDVFLGIRVGPTRELARKYSKLPLKDVVRLLKSKYHEERLLALVMLAQRYDTGDDSDRERVYKLYLRHTSYINNWDLVDLSAHLIVGRHLMDRNKKPLRDLADSPSLWERRIAVIATFYFIKQGKFSETLRISRMLLRDEEDLIHKAVGWMLREVGNRDLPAEDKFLKAHYKKMPRTMLRYAIEKFPEPKRQRYLKGKV